MVRKRMLRIINIISKLVEWPELPLPNFFTQNKGCYKSLTSNKEN